MINNVTLVGRLTKDIELRYTANGTAVGSFGIAVDRPFTNQQGERDTDFINCVVWRKTAENMAQYTRKGSLVGITGRIQTRNYEKDGQKVYVTEVVAENVRFLDTKSNAQGNQSNNQGNYSQNTQSGLNGNSGGYNNPYQSSADPIEIDDDSLPF